MNILVCVKQVRDPERNVAPDENGRWIREDPRDSYVMSPYDEHAVEEALLIKESVPNSVVEVISVGPDRAAEVIRRAMGMGADKGIHALTPEAPLSDPFAVAMTMARGISGKNYDLYLTGVMSADLNQGLVGPILAALLAIPVATAVVEQRLSADRKSVTVKRELEGGLREIVELKLPALLTIQSGINKPRYPTLSNVFRAKKQALEVVEPPTTPTTEPRQELLGLRNPEKSRRGLKLEGTEREKARRLLEIFQAKALL